MKKILKFYKPNCDKCFSTHKVLEKIRGLKVEIEAIDITELDNKNILKKYNIKTVPTVVILDDDSIRKTFIDSYTIEDILKTLTEG